MNKHTMSIDDMTHEYFSATVRQPNHNQVDNFNCSYRLDVKITIEYSTITLPFDAKHQNIFNKGLVIYGIFTFE